VARSEVERGLPSYYLKPDPEAWALHAGDKIHARYRGRASWHPAEVIGLSAVQPWVNVAYSSNESQHDDASLVSSEVRTLHGIGSDIIQLAQDYLL
jgi:hypothetical protein